MGATDFTPVLEVQVKVIPLAKSDGSGAANETKETITASFIGVNQIWAQAGIKFIFDPDTDLLPLVKDDVLVKDESVEARAALAKKHPNSLVMFLRGGTGGFSSGDSPYLTLDRFQPSHVAHEIGHYLHLHHTHGDARAVQAKSRDADGKPTGWDLDANGGQKISAEEIIRNWVLGEAAKLQADSKPLGAVPEEVIQRGLAAMDGDLFGPYRVTDTPPHFHELDLATNAAVKPDPNMRIAINVRFNQAQQHTYYWRPDYNLMSYWHDVTYQDGGKTFYRAWLSPQQIARARFGLEKGNRFPIVRRRLLPPEESGLRWGDWQMVGADVWSESAPALAALKSYLYIFRRASADARPPAGTPAQDNATRIFFMSVEDGPGFHGSSEVQGGGQTRLSPAAVSLKDLMWAIAVGLDGRVYSNFAQWGQPFGNWALVGDGMTTALPPAAAALGERLYAFAVGNGTIKYCPAVYGQPWQKWTKMGGITTNARVAAAAAGGRLHVAARNASDGLIYVCSAADGQSFGGWAPIPGDMSVGSPGSAALRPGVDVLAVTGRGDMLYVFARKGIGGQVMFTWAKVGQKFVGKWVALPLPAGVGVLEGPAAATHNGRVYIAVLGSDKRVYLRWSL